MSISTQPRLGETARERHALPDPGEPVPKLSWPILGIFSGALIVFAASSWAAIDHSLPWSLTIALNAAAIFVMFTVVHDASHYSISSHALGQRRVRPAGVAVRRRRSMAFPSFGFIHIEHHRHSNDDDDDPDTCASARHVVAAAVPLADDGRAPTSRSTCPAPEQPAAREVAETAAVDDA